jgi:hypothetical protein
MFWETLKKNKRWSFFLINTLPIITWL